MITAYIIKLTIEKLLTSEDIFTISILESEKPIVMEAQSLVTNKTKGFFYFLFPTVHEFFILVFESCLQIRLGTTMDNP